MKLTYCVSGIRLCLMLTALLSVNICFGQVKVVTDGSVGVGTPTPHESAKMHVFVSVNEVPKGFLMPVMSLAQRDAIGSGDEDNIADGLMVFVEKSDDHDEYGPYYFDANIPDWVAMNAISWSEITEVPPGFEDGIDDVDDADHNPINEIQDLCLLYTSPSPRD